MALFIITLPEEMAHVGNEIFATIRTNLPTVTPNLRIRLELVIETVYQVGTNVTVALPAQIPFSNGYVRFQLNDYLKASLSSEYDIPVVGGTAAARCNHLIRRYSLRAYEISGTPQAQTDTLLYGAMNGWFYAFDGGIPNEMFAVRPFFGTGNWWEEALPKLPFMEWAAGDVRTTPEQDQWVYLFFGYAFPGMTFGQAFYLNVLMRWDDGTTNSFNTSTVAIQGTQVWMMPVGYTQLNINAQEITYNKRCVAYSVRGAYTPPASIYTRSKTYIIDRLDYEYSRQLQYIDGLGVFRQLLLRGPQTTNVSVATEVVATYTQNDYAAYMTESLVHDIHVNNGFIQTTGSILNSEIIYFIELLASPLVMLLDERFGWVKVLVTNSSIENVPNENIKSITLQLSSAWDDTVVDMLSE